MKEFKNAVELLTLCTEKNLPISEIMRQREIILGETTAEDVAARMARVLEIMKDAAFSPIEKPVRSMGGLIGGEAKKLYLHQTSGKSICGNLLDDAITYAMATLETNASMGLIVASPTAGSAGIVPGLLLAVQKHYHFSDEQIQQALFNAGAIGYLAMRNARRCRRLPGRDRNCCCHGCFCCYGIAGWHSKTMHLCGFYCSHEYARTGL